MTGDIEQRERRKQKFAALQTAPAQAPPPVATPEPPPSPAAAPRAGLRRRDYKGERRRLNLRILAAIVDELDVFCLAAGLDKNSFCEDLSRRAIAQRLPELRKQFSDEQWAALQQAARGK
jgi:hypothetical protein